MSGPSKQVIIDSLVLVFSKSRIASIVGTDALRSVLDVQYRDLINGDTFEMQGVWDLLAEQPGFDAEYAKPPIARLKMNEGLLGVLIKLPESMADLGPVEVSGTAAHCSVGESEFQKLIAKHDPRAQAERSAKRADAQAVAEAEALREERVDTRNRLPLVIGALVVALGAFGFVGWQVYANLSPSPKLTSMSADKFKGIPVKSVKRQGAQAIVVLQDDGWVAKKDKAALESALRRVESGGVRVIIIKTSKGEFAASTQFFSAGKSRKITTRFR